jgi:hypothetical protein
VELFSQDATYQEIPFREAMRGRDAIHEYWSHVPKYQRDISFGYEVLVAEPAIVHWWATYKAIRTDDPTKLDGIFWLEFDDAGLCSSLREWWHADPAPSF